MTAPAPSSGATPAVHAPAVRRRFRLLVGPLIALITIAIMLGLGEAYFRYVVLKSDAYDFTLMAKRWKEVCWKPIFTLYSDQYPGGKVEYRDRDWTNADVEGKKKIMVIGDSFVAGHGICNAKDRFADVLQSKLGDGYAVFNVAVNGWGTPEETYFPLLYPYKPDIVVLSYFVNDIRNAITLTKHGYPEMVARPDWLTTTPLKDSYLVDFIYWQIIYKRQFAESSGKLWQALLDSYFVPDIWAEHQSEMLQFVDWAKQNNTPLIVIVWPTLESITSSARQTRMVEQLFRENGAIVISASDMLRSDPPESLVVNNIDSHPNENTHRRMAEALYDVIQGLPK
jgi:GDSL-like Lipase/Acylhydrolase family